MIGNGIGIHPINTRAGKKKFNESISLGLEVDLAIDEQAFANTVQNLSLSNEIIIDVDAIAFPETVLGLDGDIVLDADATAFPELSIDLENDIQPAGNAIASAAANVDLDMEMLPVGIDIIFEGLSLNVSQVLLIDADGFGIAEVDLPLNFGFGLEAIAGTFGAISLNTQYQIQIDGQVVAGLSIDLDLSQDIAIAEQAFANGKLNIEMELDVEILEIISVEQAIELGIILGLELAAVSDADAEAVKCIKLDASFIKERLLCGEYTKTIKLEGLFFKCDD